MNTKFTVNKKQILVVDDVEIIRALLKHTIESYNADYQVVVAATGLTALEQLRKQPFDLVVTDYAMPNMNGLQLAQAIKRCWPDVPLLLLTGDGVNTPEHEIEKVGFHGRFEKSPPFLDMLKQIDRLVQS